MAIVTSTDFPDFAQETAVLHLAAHYQLHYLLQLQQVLVVALVSNNRLQLISAAGCGV
jgi:hypothetical protein